MLIDERSSHWVAEDFGQHLVELTVGELLDRQSALHPEHEALVYADRGDGTPLRLTYAELRAQVDQLAKGLMALGVQPRDKVAMFATNVPEWLLMEFAVAKVSAVLVTINTSCRRAELEYLLRQADVRVLVAMTEHRGHDVVATLQSLIPELASHDPSFGPLRSELYPQLEHVVLLARTVPTGFRSFADLLALAPRAAEGALADRQNAVSPRDTFQIQFTSGTTGAPKGAMISHYSAINNARFFGARIGLSASDRLVSAMPLFHTAGSIMEVLGAVSQGATLIKLVSFDARSMLDLLQAESATVLSAVPTMVIAVLQDPRVATGNANTPALRRLISGGTPIPVSLMEEVRKKLGALPAIGFGMTETSPMVTGTLQDDTFEKKSSTVGLPLPHTEVKIVDEGGRTVSPGHTGELLIRGYLVMKGYYKQPEHTARTIDADGWLHSGDLATMDRQGYLRIVGRAKDMIIRGGENVYPAEVENFLMRHPDITQAQVVGVPDAYMGEEIAAFIQLREGSTLEEPALRDHCKESIARFKVPKYFRFVSNYPLTPSGKVKKFELRSRLAAELADSVAT